MRWLVTAVLLLAGCSWSNALYNARRLSNSAARAERQDRNFDAGTLWGQVAVKAESAYARDPDGDRAAEALWLRGRALAHLRDCVNAMPVLEQARTTAPAAPWVTALRLELARCQALGSDPAAAVAMLQPLVQGDDPTLRAEAMKIAGRALVRSGDWAGALAMLQDDDDPEAVWDRALALAHLGRPAEAITTIEPRIAVADSSADWATLVRAVAETSPEAVDGLLTRLGRMRTANDTVMARWRYAAAQGLTASGSGDPQRYLRAVLETPHAPSATQARMELLDRRIAAVRDSASLQEMLDSLSTLVRGDAAATFRADQQARWARAIVADLREHPAGSQEGDLAALFDASVARDTLGADRLADWLLQRFEAGWPQSPYLGKALLTRVLLSPDSAEAIRARLVRLTDSPYLAFLEGREGERFTALEDSLRFYLDDRMAAVIVGSGADAN